MTLTLMTFLAVSHVAFLPKALILLGMKMSHRETCHSTNYSVTSQKGNRVKSIGKVDAFRASHVV